MSHPIPGHIRDKVKTVAMHEVGHMIAAKVVGFPTGPITITIDPNGGYSGGAEITLVRSLRSLEEVSKYLSERVIVLWAGALAETLKGGKVDDMIACKTLNRVGETDHPKARELLNLLRNIKYPDVSAENAQVGLTALEQDLWIRTIGIVQSEAELIDGIAGRLARMVQKTSTPYTLSAAEIAAIPNLIKRFGK